MTIAADARNVAMRRLQTQLVPEICAFFFVFFLAMQMPEFGPMIILAQFGLFALLAATQPIDCLRILLRWWLLLLTPLLAVISFSWSDLPAETARYAMQLFFTAFVGVLLANLLAPSRFLAMSFLAMFAFCLISIASHRMGASFSHSVLIGLTGSKNQMALAGYALMMAALGVLLDSSQAKLLRFATLPALPVAAFIMLTTESATAILIAAAAAPLFIILWLGQRMTARTRIGVIAFIVIVGAPLLFIGHDLMDWLSSYMFDTMGKDPTLTGRTYLWERAQELIDRKPMLGFGYQYIWVSESADTLGILRWAEISDGRTFNFHNTYLQIGVDTGYTGIAFFIIVLFATALAGIRQYIFAPKTATTYFFLNFAVLITISFTEVILLPFLPRTMLLYACAVYAFRDLMPSARTAAAAAQGSWRNRHQWT